MKFKSNIDWWFRVGVLAGLLSSATPIVLGFVFNITISIIIGVATLIICGGIILPIYFNTYYLLEESKLHIQSGFCINKWISYKDIQSVKETEDPTASAGLSLDRIEIRYSTGNRILISPKDKNEFIKQLNQRLSQCT